MNRRFKAILSVLLFLSATIAIADYIKGTVRTIDYLTTNGDIQFQVNDGGTKKTPLTFVGAEGNTKFADGTLANPSIVFLADPDTGIFHAGANELDFSASGILAGYFASDGSTGVLRVNAGTTALPSLAFIGDTDTGFSSNGANSGSIDISNQGVLRWIFDSSGSLTRYSSGVAEGGSVGSGGFQFNQNGASLGAFKSRVISMGSGSTGSTGSVSVSAGISGSPTIFSITGVVEIPGVGFYGSGEPVSGTTIGAYYDPSTGHVAVSWSGLGGTKNVRAVILYQ